MVTVDEEDFRKSEKAHSILSGVSLGAVLAMLTAVFAEGGRIYLMLIGG